jgi:hypothetical protein
MGLALVVNKKGLLQLHFETALVLQSHIQRASLRRSTAIEATRDFYILENQQSDDFHLVLPNPASIYPFKPLRAILSVNCFWVKK